MQRSKTCMLAMLAFCFALSGNLANAYASNTVIVALGASQTCGKGVARGEDFPAREDSPAHEDFPNQKDFPAQLENILHAKGLNVTVSNMGINGDPTSGMLGRLASATPDGTKVVIQHP